MATREELKQQRKVRKEQRKDKRKKKKELLAALDGEDDRAEDERRQRARSLSKLLLCEDDGIAGYRDKHVPPESAADVDRLARMRSPSGGRSRGRRANGA